MTLHEYDSQALTGGQEVFKRMVQERLRQAVRVALISVLEEEVTAFVGALPYERNEQRRDQRNGHYTRDLETSMGQIEDLPVPRTRGGYQTQVFTRYHRRRDELDTAIGEMFVDGVSMAKVGQVVETLTGSKPSASTVSRVFHTSRERASRVETTPASITTRLYQRSPCSWARSRLRWEQ